MPGSPAEAANARACGSGLSETPADDRRVVAAGKFLYRGEDKLYARGFTYGTFATDGEGHEIHDRARVERDFAMMAASGANESGRTPFRLAGCLTPPSVTGCG